MKKLTEMRNRDLTEAARRCAQLARQRGQKLTLGELMAAAAACRPKLHYIEYETASRRLKQIERKGLEACVRPGLPAAVERTRRASGRGTGRTAQAFFQPSAHLCAAFPAPLALLSHPRLSIQDHQAALHISTCRV